MLETSLKKLEPSTQITDKIDQIIDAFVAFYGEERRNEIEERFRNTQILKFSSVFTLAEHIRMVKESILKELYGIPEDKYLGFGVDTLINFLTKKDTFAFEYMSKDIKAIMFGENVTSADEAFQKFQEGSYPKLNEFLKKYDDLKPILSPYEKIVEDENLKASKTREKYYQMFINEFSYLIPEDEKKHYQQLNFPGKKMQVYFDVSLFDNGHCFDDKHEELLDDEKTPSYKKDSVIRDRLRFLEAFGYKFASYDECLKDEKCVQFIKESREICQKIAERKSELYRLLTIEITENIDDYQQCRHAINEKNYVNKNDSLGPFVYESIGVSCCEVNYTIKEGQMVMTPLVLINSGASDFDCTVIHELNHALEFHTTELDSKHCSNYCGWDYDSFKFKDHQDHEQLIYKGISRKYELLSEYVNDRIAQEVTDIMHGKGDYIMDNKRSNNTSSYMCVRFLVEKFYQEFKDIIIASRSHGNIDYLLDSIGKENFESLNELVNSYYKKFGFGISGQLAVVDYYHGKPNEHSETIKDFITKRDLIMQQMHTYLQARKTSGEFVR